MKIRLDQEKMKVELEANFFLSCRVVMNFPAYPWPGAVNGAKRREKKSMDGLRLRKKLNHISLLSQTRDVFTFLQRSYVVY